MPQSWCFLVYFFQEIDNPVFVSVLSNQNETAEESVIHRLNILEARNHKSGNLEIRVPVLRNHLFSA